MLNAVTSDYTGRGEAGVAGLSEDGLLLENVGYTDGHETPMSYREMKMTALDHCRRGGRFVASQAGNRVVPDFKNSQLLSWLFPHLDPWGIGGFYEPRRSVVLSLEDQLSYLLRIDGSRFERDADFGFVYYNIRQKKMVWDSVNFRVRASQKDAIVQRLLSVDKNLLRDVIGRYERDPLYTPQTAPEQDLLRLLNDVGMVARELPGTAGYKRRLRNEIRSLIYFRGTPALFVTLNPSDIHNPLVRLLAGDEIDLERAQQGVELSEWQRTVHAASHPAACAMFFHLVISTFIDVILRHGRPERGLFGRCNAYFGTVEAQGRGTLHCHLLIWLEGHPNPQSMRDMMDASPGFRADLIQWLESLIKCELLGTTEEVREIDGIPLDRPRFDDEGMAHPGTLPAPDIEHYDEDEFQAQYELFVNDLVRAFNWHVHCETCWKYVRKAEDRDDKHCRMRIDGSTRAESTVDSETGSILLRRLHPRIANYNDLVIFLIKCNMDIKHVGSGQGAKALVQYLTNYVTKDGLPIHVGLSALLYAVKRVDDKFRGVSVEDMARQSSSALTVTVNSMLARREISHQQVMSYLVGGGDHYSSHCYRVLHYGAFDRLFQCCWDTRGSSESESSGSGEAGEGVNQGSALGGNNTNTFRMRRDVGGGRESAEDAVRNNIPSVSYVSTSIAQSGVEEENVFLWLSPGSISEVSQRQDYAMRPSDEPFNSMSVYEFVGLVEKVTKRGDLRSYAGEASGGWRGRRREARGEFMLEHPQSHSHLLRKRVVWRVPVVLGSRFPRYDRSEEEKELWARSVLILFLPWRHPLDVRRPDETWSEAFERRRMELGDGMEQIIHNMNVLSECRDAKDDVSRMRIALEAGEFSHSAETLQECVDTLEDISCVPFVAAASFYDELDGFGEPNLLEEPVSGAETLDSALMANLGGWRVKNALDACYGSREQTENTQPSAMYGHAVLCADEDRGLVETEAAAMKLLKRKRRPVVEEDEHLTRDNNMRRRIRGPLVDISELDVDAAARAGVSSSRPNDVDSEQLYALINQVIFERGLAENPEQLRAFEIVARHVCFGGPQLLMYIGGVGGTGKSYVVQAIIRLFTLLGRNEELVVGAPTGAAAILIGGYTIHSLTMLPDTRRKRDFKDLIALWRWKRYMISDEQSMIGGRFMSQWSNRMAQAKGDERGFADAPFGGVNMIFLGDFGQLRPVAQAPLYSYKLVRSPRIGACSDEKGVSALKGAYLWRCVETVVLLRKNQRQQGDNVYADLLSRVRLGQCRGPSGPNDQGDIGILRGRELSRIALEDPNELRQFADAPIIVGRKKIRDLLNARMIQHHATRIGQDVHLYHSRDTIAKEIPDLSVRRVLWSLPSSATEDSLGRMPLFPGMKVMVQENLAFSRNVVNGSEGVLRDIRYEMDEDGLRVPIVAYVEIIGAGHVSDTLSENIVPIFPEPRYFAWDAPVSLGGGRHNIARLQLPLLPSYAYTDYKSQGRTLERAVVDIESAQSLQGVYVMLSRVRSLGGLAVLRPFSSHKILSRLSQELRDELDRLDRLDVKTMEMYERTRQ